MIPFLAEAVAVQRPSFWSIADDLEAYHETLAMVEAQIVSLDTCAASVEATEEVLRLGDERGHIQQSIERLSEALVKKTDDLAGVMRRMKADVGELKLEEARIRDRRKAAEAALETLKDYTGRVMEKHGWKHLKTTQNTVALRGNGGVQPLQITQPDLVPDDLCERHGKFTADQYFNVWAALTRDGWESDDVDILFSKFSRVPSNPLIREALLQPCATCDGTGDDPADKREIFKDSCPACSGRKLATVPGARLEPRGQHVEVR